jgi:hypothetical protein
MTISWAKIRFREFLVAMRAQGNNVSAVWYKWDKEEIIQAKVKRNGYLHSVLTYRAAFIVYADTF